MHAPRWVLSTTVLARMSVASYVIEQLHVRLTAQQDHIDLVEEIIANNTNLHVIHIEVDSAVVNGRLIQPTIHLHKMFPHSRPRANIERLVIRAPGCIVDCSIVDRNLRANLFDHLRRTSEFVLVCSSFNAVTPTFEWLNCLLQKMSRVQLLDIAIDEADPQVSDISQANLPHAHLRKLERLSLQLPEVDTRFLRCIRAVSLYKLRIKRKVPLHEWPSCDDNHFPSLFIAHIQCKGPSAPRLTKRGVDPYFFDQNLNNYHNWTNDHVLPFLAYIKPYSRRRVSPPASVASADSDSDDSFTTWSELSSLSGSSSGSLSSLPDLSSFASVGSGNAPCSSGVSSSSPTVSIPVSNGPINRHDRLASPPQPMPGSSTLSIAAPGSGSTILAHNQDSASLHSPLVTFARAVAGLAK
ncbi:unnamed protein product [Tilletia laevis]|uniref:F-box domain-containing protein n=1 Tax=Tilletia laevis TaxID=157183 RepID=A0A9N8QDZ2_9BASI|nr:unnamed protein product [Tilletia laevis]